MINLMITVVSGLIVLRNPNLRQEIVYQGSFWRDYYVTDAVQVFILLFLLSISSNQLGSCSNGERSRQHSSNISEKPAKSKTKGKKSRILKNKSFAELVENALFLRDILIFIL